MSSEKNWKMSVVDWRWWKCLKYEKENFLEIVLNPVLKQMETEILEFPLSHQYNKKTYWQVKIRFLTNFINHNTSV